jgi:hypothetical protein
MSKYRIAWMPGDGVGVDVMDAAQIKARRRICPRRHRLGILVQGRRSAPGKDDCLVGRLHLRIVRRHHLKTHG